MSPEPNALGEASKPAPVWKLHDWKWCPKCGGRWSDRDQCDSCAFDTARTAPPAPWSVPENPWYAAVTNACVVNHIGWSDNEPWLSLTQLLAWESQVALDPAVSKQAQALVEQGRREASAIVGQTLDAELTQHLRAVGAWHRRMNLQLAGKGSSWASQEMYACPHGRYASVVERIVGGAPAQEGRGEPIANQSPRENARGTEGEDA